MIKLCIYTCNLGCERVKGGDDGCGWVRMGALGCSGHGAHKNKPGGGDLGSPGSEFGPYGRGNFPGHHVFQKNTKKCKEHSGWVRMGLHACKWMEGYRWNEKQPKKKQKWSCDAFFRGGRDTQKNSKVWWGTCNSPKNSCDTLDGCAWACIGAGT